MSIRELAEKYYADGYNCGEAVMMAACPDVCPELYHALGAFGGGMGCKKTCGALSACVAELGIKLIKTKQSEAQISRATIAKFMRDFEKKFGGVDCKDLGPMYQTPENKCQRLVGESAEFLEEFIKNYVKEI